MTRAAAFPAEGALVVPPRPVVCLLLGLCAPGAGLLGAGELIAGSAVLVLSGLLALLTGSAWGALALLCCGALAAFLVARSPRGASAPLPPVGAVAAVALVPGTAALLLGGAHGGLAGLGQVANRTYGRGLFFMAAQVGMFLVAGDGAMAFMTFWVVPAVSAAEAVFSAWQEVEG